MEHYDCFKAFISYRHHPVDSYVAKAVQRSLEHYTIAKEWRKAPDYNRHFRLFRDEDELPITNDINEDIQRAIIGSEFLFVICSSHTTDSLWVIREIALFLDSGHAPQDVILILAEGHEQTILEKLRKALGKLDRQRQEAYKKARADVQYRHAETDLAETPPLLLEKVLFEKEDGSSREPMLCSFRLFYHPERMLEKCMNHYAKKNPERWRDFPVPNFIPRLMPRFIRRRKAFYKLLAPLLDQPLDRLIERQKRFEMKKMLAAGCAALLCILGFLGYYITANQKISKNLNTALINQSTYLSSEAIRLLEEGDRASAVALALEALPDFPGERPYTPAAEYALSQVSQVYSLDSSAKGDYSIQTNASVEDMCVTEDGKILYTIQSDSTLSAWDLTERKLLFSRESPSLPSAMISLPDHSLLLLGSQFIICYDTQGNTLWSESGEFSYLRENNLVVRFLSPWKQSSGKVQFLDPETGKLQREITIKSDDTEARFFNVMSVLPGKNCILFQKEAEDKSKSHVLLLNAENLKLRPLPEKVYWGSELCLCPGNRLLILSRRGSGFLLICLDLADLNIQWKTDVGKGGYQSFHKIQVFPDSDEVFCQLDNQTMIFSLQTGEEKESFHTPGVPLNLSVSKDSVQYVMDSGLLYTRNLRTNAENTVVLSRQGLSRALTGLPLFTVSQDGTKITAYSPWKNPRAEDLGYSLEMPPDEAFLSKNSLAIVQGPRLVMGNLQKGTWEVSDPINGKLGSGIGFSPDGSKFFWDSTFSAAEILCFNENTIKAPETRSMELEYDGKTLSPSYVLSGKRSEPGHILFLTNTKDGNFHYIGDMNMETEEIQLFPLNRTRGFPVASRGNKILLADSDTNAYFLLNSDTGDCSSFPFQIADSGTLFSNYMLPDHGQWYELCFLDKDTIYLSNWAQDRVQSIPVSQGTPVYCTSAANGLVVLTDHFKLLLYGDSGELKSSLALPAAPELVNCFSRTQLYRFVDSWAAEDGRLILKIGSTGYVIDTEYMGQVGEIPNLIIYNPDSREFIVYAPGDDGYRIFSLPYYSREDLVRHGESSLGDTGLSEEQKARYGLTQEQPEP